MSWSNGWKKKIIKKEKKITIKKRWMHYLLAEYKNSWLIRKRDAKDIWQNLYEFILIETSDNLSKKQFLAHKQIKKFTEENFSYLKKILKTKHLPVL